MKKLYATLAQAISDAIQHTYPNSVINVVKLGFLNQARAWLVKMGDPLITYELDGFEIRLPLSHELPIYRKQNVLYSSSVARIACYVQQKYPHLTFVDIGANVGDTVAILRRLCHFPILCIEGDDQFFALLEQNVAGLKDVYLEHTFVGPTSGLVQGRIHSAMGTARLIVNSAEGETIPISTLSDVLKRHPLFANTKMIKTDTDGFDCLILRSEVKLLSHLKPVLFFEYDPYFISLYNDNGSEIFETLRQVGYHSIMVYENNGDYLLTANLTDKALLEDIHHFYSGRGGGRYCDLCAFHREDDDLCQVIRCAEIAFFQQHRLARV